MEPRIFEEGDHIYMVTPVAPMDLGDGDLTELAFAEAIRKTAPNENLMWLRGQYVEADAPNLNNQMWTAGELAIKKLTPMFMPVTVMHDPATAVGLIADVALVTPDGDKQVKRSRIDNTLAVWKHRFPEVAEEAQANYEAGCLMQSMEAISPYYSCSDCGTVFHKLPGGAERANWCDHLNGVETAAAARILGNVTFTGTGLIFGTRGAKGAHREAHLEIDQAEVAEFHRDQHKRKNHTSQRPKGQRNRKVSTVETVEISKSEYDRLTADSTKLEGLTTELASVKDEKTEVESKLEQTEAAKLEAERKLTEAETALDEAKEESRKATLADERLSALGTDFKAKLGEFTSKRLGEQAKSLTDEEWDARLTELEEMSSVKRDASTEGGEGAGAGNGGGEGGEFSREEIASAGVGAGKGAGGDGAEPSTAKRRSVVGSLVGSKS